MTVKTASQLIAEAAPQEHTKTAGAWADVYDNLMANRYANTGNGDVVSGGKVGKGWHLSVSPCFEKTAGDSALNRAILGHLFERGNTSAGHLMDLLRLSDGPFARHSGTAMRRAMRALAEEGRAVENFAGKGDTAFVPGADALFDIAESEKLRLIEAFKKSGKELPRRHWSPKPRTGRWSPK